jgi:transporter family-2 protein
MLAIAILIALAAGAANPLQAGANAELNKQLNQPVVAGLWVYTSGLLGLLIVAFAARQLTAGTLSGAGHAASHVTWWAWAGGLISIGSTMAGLMLAQRLGSGVFTGLSITAALVTSVVLDQFGWLGFRQHTASPGRLAGCVLLVAGVWLVSRF